jgi:hypothetical protein
MIIKRTKVHFGATAKCQVIAPGGYARRVNTTDTHA